MERIDLYSQLNTGEKYQNTKKENEMVQKVSALYSMALGFKNKIEFASDTNIQKWRKAYYGTLNALDRTTGAESTRKSESLRKLIYELIQAKVDNTIPQPRMTPRHRDDLMLVDITENYLKFEMDRMLTEETNDVGERATYIDGTSWYKVCWDSLDNNHERSGDVRVDILLADQVVPEPGIKNYRLMNYIFERQSISVARIYDLYGRLMIPLDNISNCNVITYYYLNENHVVSRFMYVESTNQVITWDEDWQMRKLRVCYACGVVNPIGDKCVNCGSKKFVYTNAEEEVLEEDIKTLHNPYEEGKTNDVSKDITVAEPFLTKGTKIPYYQIRQLPFVPRVATSSLTTIYGVSEVSILLDMQDAINKIMTKIKEKILKSGAVVTKPDKMKINDTDDTFKIMGVKTQEEAAMIQVKQIIADVSQDMNSTMLFYESARSSSGVTESYQGKIDQTATSGKAKEISANQSAGSMESLRVMKSAAFAGVYELIFKFHLAFSDETRRFVKLLPNGSEEEMMWNKYMFLRKDKYGNLYYIDDFAFSTDPAATLSNNRVKMWQETLQQFTMGTMGEVADPRTRELYWNIMDSMQYPLAKFIKSGIKDNSQHLPPELEQAILQNPKILQTVQQVLAAQGEQRGGARPNSGPEGNGATHRANVAKTNTNNAAEVKRINGGTL